MKTSVKNFLKLAAGATLAISAFGIGPALAQDAPPLPGELVLGDLNTPRGISIDADGNLLVAITGNGGDFPLTMKTPEGEAVVNVGLSGEVISIDADGVSTPIVQGLPSFASEQETIGLYRAIENEGSLWLVVSSGGPGQYWADSVVELDGETKMLKQVIPFYPYEVANNPDGNEIDSNVTDIAWDSEGTMYVTDAGANTLYSWTEETGIEVVATWPENSVPTSIEIAENGDLYVGFLGEGLAPGAAKIERWSNGELAETFSGLNTVTDILLDGETLYAVELVLFGEQGPGPGRVVTVTAEGSTPIAEGLMAPFAIAKGSDGALYVSFGTIAFAPGMTGGVVKLAQ